MPNDVLGRGVVAASDELKELLPEQPQSRSSTTTVFRDSMRGCSSRCLRRCGIPLRRGIPGIVIIRSTACLVADVHMPAMTGIELYQILLKKGTVPDNLITAYPDHGVRGRMRTWGSIAISVSRWWRLSLSTAFSPQSARQGVASLMRVRLMRKPGLNCHARIGDAG